MVLCERHRLRLQRLRVEAGVDVAGEGEHRRPLGCLGEVAKTVRVKLRQCGRDLHQVRQAFLREVRRGGGERGRFGIKAGPRGTQIGQRRLVIEGLGGGEDGDHAGPVLRLRPPFNSRSRASSHCGISPQRRLYPLRRPVTGRAYVSGSDAPIVGERVSMKTLSKLALAAVLATGVSGLAFVAPAMAKKEEQQAPGFKLSKPVQAIAYNAQQAVKAKDVATAEPLVAQIEAALARLRAQAASRNSRPSALIVSRRGFVYRAGPMAEIMAAAGLNDLAANVGLPASGYVTMEQLISLTEAAQRNGQTEQALQLYHQWTQESNHPQRHLAEMEQPS